MDEAQYLAEERKAIYNHEHPHRSLNGMTPELYWETSTHKKQLAIV